MKITFLGTSHGFCEKNRFCSSTAVTVGDKTYLVDAGAPITGLLRNYDIPYESLGGIFITHSHQDHYDGIVEFINQMEGFRQFADVRVKVYVPEGFPSAKIYTYIFDDPEGKVRLISGGSRSNVEEPPRVAFSTYAEEGVIFDDGSVKITAIPVAHIEHAHAFLFEAEGKRILFSGDLKSGFPDYPKVLTEGAGVDLLILEAAHTKLNSPEALALLKRTKTKRLIVNHRYHLFNTDEMIEEMKNAVSGLYPSELAFDGMRFDL